MWVYSTLQELQSSDVLLELKALFSPITRVRNKKGEAVISKSFLVFYSLERMNEQRSCGYGRRLMFKRLCVQIPKTDTGWRFLKIF